MFFVLLSFYDVALEQKHGGQISTKGLAVGRDGGLPRRVIRK